MKQAKMVSTANLKNVDGISFVAFAPELYDCWIDVYYSGIRIAIINGFSAALQWVAPNGSNIPNAIIDKVEQLVKENLILS